MLEGCVYLLDLLEVAEGDWQIGQFACILFLVLSCSSCFARTVQRSTPCPSRSHASSPRPAIGPYGYGMQRRESSFAHSKTTTREGTSVYTRYSPLLTLFLRRIASIDFSGSIILSGSSDNHIRLFDMATSQGWSTSPDYDVVLPATSAPHHHHMAAGGSVVGHPVSGLVCQSCGSNSITSLANVEGVGGGLNGAARSVHTDLVRTVALGEEFVLSGSYDLSIKVRVD